LQSHYGKSSGIGKLNRAATLLFLLAGDAASSITAAGDAIKEPAIVGTLGEELLPSLSALAGVSCGA
jgi:hypothetical protein